ncbi:hypothetical protein AMES_7980 [Amycolatopsis mediterranei S699]|uniref:Uncharacterized protein n=2 Tax=Amycolatopsis mediterranei TaxID=33910 RepID=A0A0H3DG16_AMYMU|nr:hypothetical protein [Amycolatopsis mediterranei]ADJ49805.1 conserved hypothetical protein [Amycolatopsis mediterranei U32]AEK46792.1 hypothetical protein RAM_41625 [Amycolatopsis mediterranei S699]AFO81513.1 hypothetical protein AMES_7980 [Amycolatopsis mediterranei S699]AGT88642.1 hypothetical protein B737_7981 [Amycolatopsis mediterranei RB]KDO07946.1 hypothetical protein DV26_27050 [Amycolatopsis mediterranei]
MAPGNDANTARRARATRSAGLLPLVIGLASAAALTGAAYFTVDNASCGSPAQYIRHDSHVELVGGCVDGAKLPAAGTSSPGGVVHGNYNP